MISGFEWEWYPQQIADTGGVIINHWKFSRLEQENQL